jgi:hypothetical protein
MQPYQLAIHSSASDLPLRSAGIDSATMQVKNLANRFGAHFRYNQPEPLGTVVGSQPWFLRERDLQGQPEARRV